jgi:hypothetical protein
MGMPLNATKASTVSSCGQRRIAEVTGRRNHHSDEAYYLVVKPGDSQKEENLHNELNNKNDFLLKTIISQRIKNTCNQE